MPGNESQLRNRMAAMLAVLKTPQIALARPQVNLFLMQYMAKFPLKRVGGKIILHSHLPPVNSKAFVRFVNEQLVGRSTGPSHAQVGLTDACLQHCKCCYSQYRSGRPMDTETIVNAIRDLKRLGVFWLGFTGGEPLLNRDIVRITKSVGDDCAVKLFTTGCGLTRELATGLQGAGLYSVSVSLDHREEAVHDLGRDQQRPSGGFPALPGGPGHPRSLAERGQTLCACLLGQGICDHRGGTLESGRYAGPLQPGREDDRQLPGPV